MAIAREIQCVTDKNGQCHQHTVLCRSQQQCSFMAVVIHTNIMEFLHSHSQSIVVG